jgi:hypothetical protein
MCENGMKSVHSIPGMGREDKGERYRGWIQLWYIVRTFECTPVQQIYDSKNKNVKKKIPLQFLEGLYSIYRLLSVYSHFHNINSANQWTYEDFPCSSSFFSFLQDFLDFIVEVVHISARFIPRYLIFQGYCEWDCFPDFFLSLFTVSILKNYWFVYVDL